VPLILPALGGPNPRPETLRLDAIDLRFSLTQGENTLPLLWDGAGYRVLDVEGLDDPVMDAVVDEAPGVWGGFPGGLHVPAREVVFQLRVEGRGGQAYKELRAALRLVTNPVPRPTLITVTDGDGWSHTRSSVPGSLTPPSPGRGRRGARRAGR
jgi:hypothetical protein